MLTEDEVNPTLDVIFYQGANARGLNKYSGYYKYQDLVKEKEQTYASVNNNDKRLIAQSIVDTVVSAGGRYLQRIKIDGKTFYEVLGNKAALKKTAKALKDARYRRERKTAQGAASLLALADAQPNTAASTNTPPLLAPSSLSNDTATNNPPPSQAPPTLSIDDDADTDLDIIRVCDFIDLTRSD